MNSYAISCFNPSNHPKLTMQSLALSAKASSVPPIPSPLTRCTRFMQYLVLRLSKLNTWGVLVKTAVHLQLPTVPHFLCMHAYSCNKFVSLCPSTPFLIATNQLIQLPQPNQASMANENHQHSSNGP